MQKGPKRESPAKTAVSGRYPDGDYDLGANGDGSHWATVDADTTLVFSALLNSQGSIASATMTSRSYYSHWIAAERRRS